jgi:hypothetical protein
MQATKTVTHLRLTFLLALSILAAALLQADHRMAGTSAAPSRQRLPALQGQPAVDYLKEQGIYDRLHESIQAGQYELEQLPQRLPAVTGARYRANNPAQHLQASFSGEQMLLEPVPRGGTPHWQAGLKLRGVGYGARLNAVAAGSPRTSGNRIEIPRAALTEWYVNTKEGIEQGFTLNERPGVTSGGKPLRVVLAVTGELKAGLENAGQAVVLALADGKQVLRYDHLMAWDSLGRALPSRMEVQGEEMALVVDDAAAVYPVTIDPLFTEVKKLTASDGATFDNFGVSVALSGDTVVVGAYGKNTSTGAAYIYERNQGGAGNWGEVKILTASDAAVNDNFGVSVWISGDTVVAGAQIKNSSTGAAYIFERNQGGANNWGEVKKLTASDPAANDQFGVAVTVEADTIVIGAHTKISSTGAAYIYSRNQGGAGNWGEVKKLTASDPAPESQFGCAVAINADTLVIGSAGKFFGTGAAYIFERNQGGAGNWGQIKKLTASDANFNSRFGTAVAISADTVVAGADLKNNITGAAYLYERNRGGAENWGEVKILTASDAAMNSSFGRAVGISGDTVVVGAHTMASATGAAYLYDRNQGGAENWGEIQKLAASDAGIDNSFGISTAILGNRVLVGAYGQNSFAGATYIFDMPLLAPTLSKAFNPAAITIGGTSTVTLTLTNPNATPLTNAAFSDTLTNMSAAGGAVGGTCAGIAPGSLSAGATGLSFSGITIPASGSCTVTFDVTSSTIGVQPNTASGVTATETSAAGTPSNTASLIVTCPAITLSSLPAGTAGTGYSQTLTAAPGVGTYSFAVTAGSLPAGLSLAPSGAVTGTPSQAGTFNFTVTATGVGSCTGSRAYTLSITCPAIMLSPGSLPGVTFNTAYSQTLSATPASGSYSFSLTSGILPAGLSLSPSGSLSGTPTQTGAFTFRVTATAFGSCTGFFDYALTVACASINLTPGSLPGGTVGTAYSQTVNATPSGIYSYAVTSGALPNGLSLNSTTGAITGTPTTAGTFSFTVTATAGSCTGLRSYSVAIGCPAITLAALGSATAGSSYAGSAAASPAGTYTYSLSTGSLPSGLSLNASSGTITGTATVSGTYNFMIQAQAGSGCIGAQSYALVVACPTITLSALPVPSLNTAYNQTVTASPAGSYSFAVTAGVLPTGLSLNSATGVVSGTPTVSGAYSFTITATGFGTCTGSSSYSGTIAGIGCTVGGVTLAALPPGTVGMPYNNYPTALPVAMYTYSLTAGSLPPGLILYPSIGLISGYPTTPGTYNFTILATDGNTCVGMRSYTVVIN